MREASRRVGRHREECVHSHVKLPHPAELDYTTQLQCIRRHGHLASNKVTSNEAAEKLLAAVRQSAPKDKAAKREDGVATRRSPPQRRRAGRRSDRRADDEPPQQEPPPPEQPAEAGARVAKLSLGPASDPPGC